MDNNNNIVCNIEEMDLTKLSKPELLKKCEELGFAKCKSKNKGQLIDLINSKSQIKKQMEKQMEKQIENQIEKQIEKQNF